jgi:hypothetical protein
MIVTNKEKKLRDRTKIIKKGQLYVPEELFVSEENYYQKEEGIQKLQVKCSDWVEYACRVPDMNTQQMAPFSLKERPYWKHIYNTDATRLLIKSGRQCEKSTFLGNRMLFFCCICPSFHCLYVSPSQKQSKEYTNDRIKTPIETSEILKTFTNYKLMDNADKKEFINNSRITIRYAFLNADRTRGIANVQCLCIDELQDIIIDNIGIIEQTTFASTKYQYYIYSGTPKTLENPIEVFWSQQSTQNEWAIPCWNHYISTGSGASHVSKAHWNIIIDTKQIELKGLSCELCKKLIDPRDPSCQWISMNPNVREKVAIPYEGYHIPQVISPNCRWGTIINDYKTKPPATFMNETLGISYDSGEKPLTRNELERECVDFLDKNFVEQWLYPKIGNGSTPLFMGIDWGGGSETSKTVVCIAAYIKDNTDGKEKFTAFYWKRYDGADSDPNEQVESIIALAQKWRVRMIGTDYGGGFLQNSKLKNVFGMNRVHTFQYANPKQKVMYQGKLDRNIVHRSEVMSDVFGAIKFKRFFKFPKWKEFQEPFGNDFLAIGSELNSRGSIIFNKNPSLSDDSFHALLYCFLGSFTVRTPPDDIILPGARTKEYDEYI